MITRDKIAGALYGVALGDALGRPTEFMGMAEIRRQYGRRGVMRMPSPALFTDDTQMTLAVARALRDAPSLDPRRLVQTLRREFLWWAAYDPPRAPGVTCMTSIRGYRRGEWHGRWVHATQMSKGCGANMRVVPTALLPDLRDALGASQLQAALTHGHPTAIAATELTALAVRWAAEGAPLHELPRHLLSHAYAQRQVYRGRWLRGLRRRWRPLSAHDAMTIGWDACARGLRNLMGVLTDPRDGDPCEALGGGWVADQALTLGLYCAIRHADKPALAVSLGARTSGDSDSIASIAGAIVGAAHGEGGWPTEWVTAIERRADIEDAVDTVLAAHVRHDRAVMHA